MQYEKLATRGLRLGKEIVNLSFSSATFIPRQVVHVGSEVGKLGQDILGVFTRPEISTNNSDMARKAFQDVDIMAERLNKNVQRRDDYRESDLEERRILCATLCLRAVDLLKDPNQDWETTEKRLEKLSIMFGVMPEGFYRDLDLPDDDIKLLENHYKIGGEVVGPGEIAVEQKQE